MLYSIGHRNSACPGEFVCFFFGIQFTNVHTAWLHCQGHHDQWHLIHPVSPWKCNWERQVCHSQAATNQMGTIHWGDPRTVIMYIADVPATPPSYKSCNMFCSTVYDLGWLWYHSLSSSDANCWCTYHGAFGWTEHSVITLARYVVAVVNCLVLIIIAHRANGPETYAGSGSMDWLQLLQRWSALSVCKGNCCTCWT